jgi:MoaA/NifB/PqqE/SkfB family radical SAM enzyme
VEIDTMKKVYIEPTSRCNLNCSMCPRSSWQDEMMGDMDMGLFNSLIDQIKEMKSVETIFFGGIAEPLSHPKIIEMIQKAKTASVQVEMISNGAMLNEDILEKLLFAGLDTLWISVDLSHTKSYEELTGQSGFEKAKANLLAFNLLKRRINPDAKIGIAFVAMKSNIEQLPEIISLASVMGVSELKVSNVIPFTREMQAEMLYNKSLSMMGFRADILHNRTPLINMPIMDFDLLPKEVLASLLRAGRKVQLGEHLVERKAGCCKFIEEDSLFVRWDGEVSPCMATLHTNKTYLHDVEREIKFCSFGCIKTDRIADIWHNKEYTAFRTTIKKFDFSPCTTCGACSYVEDNMEDCIGNPFPTCGGCLWAEGFAQCP